MAETLRLLQGYTRSTSDGTALKAVAPLCVTRKVDSDEELRIIVKIGKCAGSFASCVNEEAEDGVAKSKLIYK